MPTPCQTQRSMALRVVLAEDNLLVREGLEREIHQVDGRWLDDVVMGVLEHEWRGRVGPA